MKPESLISKLKTIEANAAETQRWAAKAIKELEGPEPKKRKKGGLSEEELNQIGIRYHKRILNKQRKLNIHNS